MAVELSTAGFICFKSSSVTSPPRKLLKIFACSRRESKKSSKPLTRPLSMAMQVALLYQLNDVAVKVVFIAVIIPYFCSILFIKAKHCNDDDGFS